ncbi:glycosyltransferase family 2 protein [Paenibacillus wynnii]|uniref:glycosyltransferase family 2 protein n=1 Tax=Paenibacillus wynnii TaxID=268407 RepID=UPI002792B22F|nr:glycosyltransferase family 2 protein [Paenibacillus wynnii]MDQ0193758.1 GT2 family glycosyltransferase [Paenibacillus wynnii]
MAPIVSIVILTFNQIEYTQKCLASLLECTKTPYELIIVDNCSTDRTPEFLESFCIEKQNDIPVVLIKNNKNQGYAKGCNQGIHASTAPYICLLNNDTELTPEWLENLLECLKVYPEAEVVGPYTDGMYPPMYVHSKEDLPGGIQETDTLYGYCMLFRRSLIDRIGGLDEVYGIGNFEDVDFIERVIRIGGKPIVAGNTFIYHKHHASWNSEFKLRLMVAKNLQRFRAKWGYGESFDGGFKDRPYFSCETSLIIIVPVYPRELQEFINAISPEDMKKTELVFIDEYANEEVKEMIVALRNQYRIIHIQACSNQTLTKEQLVQMGVNNSFGKTCKYMPVERVEINGSSIC